LALNGGALRTRVTFPVLSKKNAPSRIAKPGKWALVQLTRVANIGRQSVKWHNQQQQQLQQQQQQQHTTTQSTTA